MLVNKFNQNPLRYPVDSDLSTLPTTRTGNVTRTLSADANKPREMIGKVVIYYDEKQRRVIATAVANFTAKFSLNGGAVHVVAEYLGRELYNVKHKVCKMGAETFSCPIEKGKKMHVNEKVKLPQYIPRGEYYATAKLMNENEECLGMTESNIIL